VRLPPFVIGNGTDSLSTLIEAKTALRAGHPYLQRMPIQVDTTVLAQQNITYTSAPSDGAVVVLNESVSLYDGGEPMDVSHDVHPELQQLAIQSAQAIPGDDRCRDQSHRKRPNCPGRCGGASAERGGQHCSAPRSGVREVGGCCRSYCHADDAQLASTTEIGSSKWRDPSVHMEDSHKTDR